MITVYRGDDYYGLISLFLSPTPSPLMESIGNKIHAYITIIFSSFSIYLQKQNESTKY